MLAFFVSWRTSLFVGLGALLLILLVGLGVYSIYHNFWVIPHRHIASVNPGVLKQKEIQELRNNIRQSFIQALGVLGGMVGVLGGIIGGAALLGGLYYTTQTLRISQETLRVNQKTLETTQQGQITDRFSKAIEHLGDKDQRLMVVLGGIYALERIAKDSAPDYWSVMRVLTAFVRQKRPLQNARTHDPLPEDIQSILVVLGRRTPPTEEPYGLELQGTNLQNAYLSDAKLGKINLVGAELQDASLHKVQLKGADLRNAQLQDAILEDVELQGAALGFARLQGATLTRVHLDDANLYKTQLQGVDLTAAEGLIQSQIDEACVDDNTTLPEGLNRPQRCPANP